MKNINVPLLKQKEKLDCGPIALKMVLKYFGKNISENKIIKEVGGIGKYGVKAIKLAEFAKSLGLNVIIYSYNRQLSKGRAILKKPSKINIIKFLKKKIPVVVSVRQCILYKKNPSKKGHYIVITKYEKGKFWYNDPYDGKQHKINENDLIFALFKNALDSTAYLIAISPKV